MHFFPFYLFIFPPFSHRRLKGKEIIKIRDKNLRNFLSPLSSSMEKLRNRRRRFGNFFSFISLSLFFAIVERKEKKKEKKKKKSRDIHLEMERVTGTFN